MLPIRTSRLIVCLLFVNAFLLAQSNAAQADKYISEDIYAEWEELEVVPVDTIFISANSYVLYLSKDEKRQRLLFYKSEDFQFVETDYSGAVIDTFLLNPKGDIKVGSILSACGYDLGGNIIVVTERGVFQFDQSKSLKVVKRDWVEYPRFVNQKLIPIMIDDVEHLAYEHKTFFNLLDSPYGPDDYEDMFRDSRLLTILNTETKEDFFGVAINPESILFSEGFIPATLPGSTEFIFPYDSSIGSIMHPEMRINLHSQKDSLLRSDSYSFSAPPGWMISEGDDVIRQGMPKSLIVNSQIRSAYSSGGVIFFSFTSGIDEELYDEGIVKFGGDFNKTMREYHDSESLYQQAIILDHDDINNSKFYATKLNKGFHGIEVHISDNLYLISADALAIDFNDKWPFFICEVNY